MRPNTRRANTGLNVTMTLPATPVITTAEAKTALRVDFNDDDDFIDALIESATLYFQKKLNRAFISQTVIAEWDQVGYEVPLPYAPVSAVSEVAVVDYDGTTTALTSGTGYTLRNGVVRVNTNLGLKVTYTAGYGATSATVPQPIRTAIERMVINLYDRRDDTVENTNIEEIAMNSLALVQPYMNYK